MLLEVTTGEAHYSVMYRILFLSSCRTVHWYLALIEGTCEFCSLQKGEA